MYMYIHTYIYMCVCVCVYIYMKRDEEAAQREMLEETVAELRHELEPVKYIG